MPEHANLALTGAKLAGRQLQQRTLPRPVWAKQTNHPLVQPEREVIHADHMAVPFRNSLKFDRGVVRGG